MKQIVISEEENGQTSLKADKGIKWATFITGIEMMIDCVVESSEIPYDIDAVLADIKRIYERDKEEE